MEPLSAALGTTVSELLGLEAPSAEEMMAAAAELHRKEKLKHRREMRWIAVGFFLYGIALLAFMYVYYFLGPETVRYDGLPGKVLALNIKAQRLATVMMVYGASLVGAGIGTFLRTFFKITIKELLLGE